MRTIDWCDGAVEFIDQTRLPAEAVTVRAERVSELVDAIRRLAVRGAPALGVAGALGVALAHQQFRSVGGEGEPAFDAAVGSLREARPTAVNLGRMVDRVAARADEGFDAVLAEALAVRDEEIAASIAMGERGARLIAELSSSAQVRAMTVCNTGGLASVERGTALAVLQRLHELGQLGEVLALETRPLLQGARLTTWELQRMAAPHRLIVDSAGPFLIARGEVDVVVTGADRIAANGDTANKVGTFSLALAARHTGIPFVVVAPESTVDMDTPSGADIRIEDRGAAEVVSFNGSATAPSGTEALNPAFDVTPVALITALVTDRRVVRFDRGEDLGSIEAPDGRFAADPSP
ncbi:MAG TPA: S-methyl-5-thioribose-1-phosphate isomerase, partial [Egibacteraceae bacterium]|nr:S-methyl-5-thioribose-1-phosphate isomerase [Egibacteraceae bacterium]